jgi:hypothetical protein
MDKGAVVTAVPLNLLSLRERVRVRGSKELTARFISPHPGLLPEGEGRSLLYH